MKARKEKIAALTAYDFPMAKLLDECGVPILLVGDSLGMVVLGYPDTTHVTMAEIEHHTRAAARAKPRALLGADLPYKSYETPEQAVVNDGLELHRTQELLGGHFKTASGRKPSISNANGALGRAPGTARPPCGWRN